MTRPPRHPPPSLGGAGLRAVIHACVALAVASLLSHFQPAAAAERAAWMGAAEYGKGVRHLVEESRDLASPHQPGDRDPARGPEGEPRESPPAAWIGGTPSLAPLSLAQRRRATIEFDRPASATARRRPPPRAPPALA